MYASPPTTFDELIAPFPEEVREISLRVREIVTNLIPEADENVSGGKAVGIALYSIGGEQNVVCGIQPGKNACKLYLHNMDGVQSPLKLEGSGKHARHVKLRALSEADVENVRWLVEQAAGLVR